ncbi:MAG: hypothetical protein ABW185_29190 [Sedimenticola sp.]
MATVYKVRDGSKGDRTDEGSEVLISHLLSKLAGYSFQFLSEEHPQFNVEKPTYHYKYVVVEITDKDELSEIFHCKWFYVVENLDAASVDFIFQ